MALFDLAVGCGQGGARIAKVFAEIYKMASIYLNLTEVDFSKFEVPWKQGLSSKLVIEAGGSGRDPVLGEEIVRENFRKVSLFLKDALDKTRAENVLLCVGGGGGSGGGFLFPLLEYFEKRKLNVLTVFTLPQKREGIPVQPNAMKTLDKMIIDGYVDRKKFGTIVVDNDFCATKYGFADEDNYWDHVNQGIALSLKRFYGITTLDGHKNYIDVAAGYKALDYRELTRLLYFGQGFLDIREVSIESPKNIAGLRKAMAVGSLINSNMQMNTTKAYLVSVALPQEWKGKKAAADIVDESFDIVSKMTKTPYAISSSYYSSKLRSARVSVLLAGVTRSKAIEKQLKMASKNVQKYRDKGRTLEGFDVENLEF